MNDSGGGVSRTAIGIAVALALLLLPSLGLAQPSRHFRFRFAEDFQEITLDGRTRGQLAKAAQPSKDESYLGLELRDGKTEPGCLVRGLRPGPIREKDLIHDGDHVLSLNGIETDTSEQFRQAFAPVKPGDGRLIGTIEYRRPPDRHLPSVGRRCGVPAGFLESSRPLVEPHREAHGDHAYGGDCPGLGVGESAAACGSEE